MSQGSLPVDDLPPSQPLPGEDSRLHHQLEKALCRHFFETCDGTIQSRLMSCRWTLTLRSAELILTIHCADESSKQQIVSTIKSFAQGLKPFSNSARICIFSPQDSSASIEVLVEQILTA